MKLTPLAVFAFALMGLASHAKTPDNCPVKGSMPKRMNYLLDHLPAMNSPMGIQQAWHRYRDSTCRFDQILLSRWPSNVPLYEQGYSNLETSGKEAAKTLSELAAIDNAMVEAWYSLSAKLKEKGLRKGSLLFSMTDLSSDKGPVGRERTEKNYYISFLQHYFAGADYYELGLSLDIEVTLLCSIDHCSLTDWKTQGPYTYRPSGYNKGASSGAGGQIKQ